MKKPEIPVKIGELVKSLIRNDENFINQFKFNLGYYGPIRSMSKLKGICYITTLKIIFYIKNMPLGMGPVPLFIIFPRNSITNIEIKKDWIIIKWRSFSTFEEFRFKSDEKDKQQREESLEKIVKILTE
ncbi:MAG: hypothetical protein ACFFCM_04115 [Promethearchaeota archaeon]